MKKQNPSVIVSFTPIAVLVALLYIVIRTFGSDSLAGGSQVSLLAASAVCVAIAMLRYGVKWQTLEEAISKNIYSVGPTIADLLWIGDYAPKTLLGFVLCNLGSRFGNDGQFVDHNRHNRRGTDRYRTSAGFR